MPTTFFTADHHFGHRNIIPLCERPFADVDEMNEAMIERWNARVGPEDTVYHLGDLFHLARPKTIRAVLDRLQGRKILIPGNHDGDRVLASDAFEEVSPLIERWIDGRYLVLCHYALRVWRRQHHGAWMLYGHSHGNLPPLPGSLDVGVDAWDFCPATLAEIAGRIETREEKTTDP